MKYRLFARKQRANFCASKLHLIFLYLKLSVIGNQINSGNVPGAARGWISENECATGADAGARTKLRNLGDRRAKVTITVLYSSENDIFKTECIDKSPGLPWQC